HTSFSRDWSSDVCSSDLLDDAEFYEGSHGLNILQSVTSLVKLGIIQLHVGTRRPSIACHQIVLRGIDGDPINPGIKSAITTKIGNCPVRLDKGLLSQIGRASCRERV